jgi:hypothetical protein
MPYNPCIRCVGKGLTESGCMDLKSVDHSHAGSIPAARTNTVETRLPSTDELWDALREVACVTEPSKDANTIVTLRRAHVKAALALLKGDTP